METHIYINAHTKTQINANEHKHMPALGVLADVIVYSEIDEMELAGSLVHVLTSSKVGVDTRPTALR
jgi:hypothetical protein